MNEHILNAEGLTGRTEALVVFEQILGLVPVGLKSDSNKCCEMCFFCGRCQWLQNGTRTTQNMSRNILGSSLTSE